MQLSLVVTSKNDQSSQNVRCSLDERLVLGRTVDSPIPLDGAGISREHLAIESEGEEIFVTDLSSNGSWVNGDRIPRSRRHRVQPGDAIELPGYEIHFQLLAGPEKAPAATTVSPVPAAAPPAPARIEPAMTVAAPAGAVGKALGPVASLLGSFSGLEIFMLIVDALAIVLLVNYFAS
ncbi:MAG: FHA domain-containing protein [Bryobacteraceae bacterium]